MSLTARRPKNSIGLHFIIAFIGLMLSFVVAGDQSQSLNHEVSPLAFFVPLLAGNICFALYIGYRQRKWDKECAIQQQQYAIQQREAAETVAIQQQQAEEAHRAYLESPAGKIESSLKQLDQYAAMYKGYPVQHQMQLIAHDMKVLFTRLQERGTAQQLLITQTQYANILEKVIMCISPDYLKDIIDNPTYWDHPEKRIADVIAVLDIVPEQIVQNIRQVNSSTDLDFQTALAVLNNLSDNAEIEAIYQRMEN